MPVLWRMLPSPGIVMEAVPSTDMLSNRRCHLQEPLSMDPQADGVSGCQTSSTVCHNCGTEQMGVWRGISAVRHTAM